MSWDIILTLIALVWVCTPAKYDPAIKLKEWLERKDR